ncbi:membrane-spanning 4-domains subfamily A member 12-like [Tachysurus fulvidraco]|uniref:membrane-spanning 4-domains subfamily A member 12-like n=1 Tax=Tachysurus fulvidraco TaxID=1234273 RepID=UPI001FEE8188|nr:membrane-spanning 4-domains subfamily A member 12-like [Tachysurus fulvidraco]XP_026995971.2 membrane-spanning 4-domains subfamily A member 12-like [Tachysurus fulvidraco]
MPLPAIKTDSKSPGIVQMMIGVVILSFGFLLNNVPLNNVPLNNVKLGDVSFTDFFFPPNKLQPDNVQPTSVQPLCVRSKAMYWGSICFLIAGSLSVAAMNYRNPFVVKSTLVMNLLSALAAVLVIIMLSVDLKDWKSEMSLILNYVGQLCRLSNGCPELSILEAIQGTFIVPLAFSILEVCMAIWTFVLLWKSRNN